MYSLPQILFSSSSVLLDPAAPDGPEMLGSDLKDQVLALRITPGSLTLLAHGRGSLPRPGWLGSRPSDKQKPADVAWEAGDEGPHEPVISAMAWEELQPDALAGHFQL